MVGGKNGHKRVAFGGVTNMDCRERDSGGGVAANGFGDDAFSGSCRQLFSKRRSLLSVGDSPDAVRRNQRTQTRDSLLEHGLLADDVEELLGRARAAARPEARAATTGEDYGVS